MLLAIAVALIILWFMGILISFTLGGFIHVLLVIALVAFLFHIFRGRQKKA